MAHSLAVRIMRGLPDSPMGLKERGIASLAAISRFMRRAKQAGFVVETHREHTSPGCRPRTFYATTALGQDLLDGEDPDGHLGWLGTASGNDPAKLEPKPFARSGYTSTVVKMIYAEDLTAAEVGRRIGISRAIAHRHIQHIRTLVSVLPNHLEGMFTQAAREGVGPIKARAIYEDLLALGALKFSKVGVELSPQGMVFASRLASKVR